MKGAPSSLARSYIHTQSAQLYARCLSLNTGTDRPDVAKTPQTCSKKYLRGYICRVRSLPE